MRAEWGLSRCADVHGLGEAGLQSGGLKLSILGVLTLDEQRLPLQPPAPETFSPPPNETVVKDVHCTVIYTVLCSHTAAKDWKQPGSPPLWRGTCGGHNHRAVSLISHPNVE